MTTGDPIMTSIAEAPPAMALEFDKGDLVWFDPGVGHVLPGEVMEFHRPAQVLTVQAVIAGKPQVFTLTSLAGVRRRQDLGQQGVEDMIQLSDLNEASLLWNLKIRYDRELIYTYTGSILVAVNPYKMSDIYGLDMVKKYEGQILGTLPPHLFAIGSSAYAHLSKEGERQNQVVVISGESGSGKTESTKLVMQYLAAVNKSPSNLITEQILEASPLLESFGNAKTVRNDNSSRFGKYLEVHFKEGVIIGAKVTEYLLEKSRIVTQAQDERNYHVFYEMLTGLSAEQKQKYGLLTPEKYFYLNQGGSCEIDGKYDSEDFQSLLSAMQVLGFTMDEQDNIFRILASVLHLGNVYFHRKQLKHGTEGVEIGSDAEIRWTGHLLQLNVDGIKRALTTKTTEARNERLLTPLSIDQALDARDAFAKALYSALFSWLVQRINSIVFKGTKRTAAISILDIFGFEDFKENSFEQLCINYANENLQFYFNKHIFKLEQQEYARDKIDWQTITYNDNMPVINLIAKKPVGILHLLDDESNFPKASDLSFLEKCHYNHALDELYSRPRMSSLEFGVRHYAGQVWYNVEGFLDKNRDTLRPDVVELLINSKVTMLSRMFQSVRSHHETAKTLNKANGRFVTMKPRTPTVAARFHDSLQQLLESMTKCNPWFVRCIKPNNDKAPMKLDMPIVLEQLRYTGMLETIRIRKTGYPIRLKFAHFVERYRYLLQPRGCSLPRGAPYRELCRAILDQTDQGGHDYQLGTTRVFMRENLERRLEKERADILRDAAVMVQRHVRGYLARRRYRACKRSAVKLQAAVRGYSARKKFRVIRTGVVRAQANFRAKRQRKRYLELKEELKRRSEVEKVARERAKAKAQRDEQERTSRAVAGVNHLEIPAELAFIFSKLDDWQPTHTERNLVKVVGGVPPRPDRYFLPNDIDYHAFTKFTNVYFKSHLWGMKREPIKTPFLAKSKDIDYQDSLAIFKLILRFMNDNNLNGKKEVALGDYIVNKGIVNERLRDEILCQLCNQTWKNEKDANNERGWLLLANCLSCFPPSPTLYKFLLKYVSDHGWDGYKAVCQRKLLQSQCARVGAANGASGQGQERDSPAVARTYPPCLLEWRANRKRVNMALPVHFADGEQRMTPVEAWTTSEELASLVVRERGIAECGGWSVSLATSGSDLGLEPGVKDSAGYDYVLDLVAEMELAPAFPACRNSFLSSPDRPKRTSSTGNSKVLATPAGPVAVPIDAEIDEPPLPSPTRRPGVPPPEPPVPKQPAARKTSREPPVESKKKQHAAVNGASNGPGRLRSQSRDHTVEMGLSRKSALNDRYFEDKPGRSRSLDNLLESEMAPPRKLESLGLSQSRLNDRYHSMEKMPHAAMLPPRGMSPSVGNGLPGGAVVPEPPLMRLSAVSNKEYMTKSEAMMEDNLESVSQRGRDSPRKYSLSSKPDPALELLGHHGQHVGHPHLLDFDYPDMASQACRSEDDKGSYIRGHPRFIKSHYAGKRAAPGSHSSRAYIEGRNSEKSEYGAKSSALSDTSEAPSLASHVRRVRVPSQASDVDQFLDDLFMPVLDGNLDELSDARSLAASIKGGGDHHPQGAAARRVSTQSRHSDADDEVATLTGSAPSASRGAHGHGAVQNVDDYISDLFQPIFVNESLRRLTRADTLANAIKGGGQGLGGIETRQTATQSQSTAAFGFTPIGNVTSPTPMMMTGMISPPPLMMQGVPAMPMFSPQGASNGQQPSSLMSDPTMVAYQQSLQRAFLQSAMAQNIQIQQQLLAQNQALQTLLQTQANSPNASGQSSGQTPPTSLAPSQAASPSEEQSAVESSASTPSSVESDHEPEVERVLKVSFREPENGDLWSTEKQQNSISSPGPPLPPKARSTPIQPVLTTVTRAQVHRSQSPTHSSTPRKASLTRSPSNPHTAFTSVLSELRSRKSSVDSNQSNSRGIPPPPPPPMPPPPEHMDPSEVRPFLDPYGRAKTVRIGKWRWPPPQDNGESADSFLHFKLRQQQRKVSPLKSSHDTSENGEGVEWEEFEMDSSPTSLEPPRKSSSTSNLSNKRDIADKNKSNIVRSNLDLHSASSPSSVGKLRISSEMRSKLELVTANHSLRSTTKTEKPALSLLNNMQPNGPQRTVSKLQDDRKLLLEQQLAGRWGSVDSVDAVQRGASKDADSQPISNVRSQVERMEKPNNATPHSANASMTGWKPAPPPPPIIPHYNAEPSHHAPASRTNSFYSQSNTPGIPQPRSPPPPIQPVRLPDGQRDLFGSSPGRGGSPAGRMDRMDHRRASVSTHHTDVMERIEIEESSEFLQPVDSSPPLMLDRRDLDRSVETTKTKLYNPSSAAFFTYNRVPWRLNIKKEVFAPNEALSTPLALHLVFCQIVQDTLSPNCIRIGREERASMRKMLDNYGVTLNNLQSAHHKNTIKKNVVDMAKQWNVYFARIFPVSGGHQNPDVQFLAISHSGVRLVRKEKSVPHDYLHILDTFTFDEIAEVTMPKSSSVQFMLSAGGRVLLYTHRANQVHTMLHKFILEACKGGQEFVRGVQDHVSHDQSLLSFRKGDVIRLINRDQHLQKGWLCGSLNGRSGLFPCDFVEALARHHQHNQTRSGRLESFQPDHRKQSMDGWTGRVAPPPQPPHQAQPQQHGPASMPPANGHPVNGHGHHNGHLNGHAVNGHSNGPSSLPSPLSEHGAGQGVGQGAQVHDGKHSLLQFAIHHFRQSPEKFEMLKTADGSISGSLDVIESLKNNKKNKGKSKGNKENEWTWKEQVDLVKFSPRPIEQSLLRLEPDEVSELAVECFVCVMRYMGDLPMTTDVTEVKCVYTVLMHCHKHEALRDEVYCHLMKQTTNNKSQQPESCQRGWRLFSIVAAYFACSDTLKPYLFKYLETAAYDKRRAYHGTAMVCLQNLRKTFKYGGRKNVPSVEEITAISAGRNSKRQMYRLPGGTERVVNTRSTTVVQDVIEEICGVINVASPQEMEEFSLYCIVEGDTFTMPLAREEYILDVTTELHKNQQVFYLIFCRSVWHFPLRLDSHLYVEVVFNQIAPDYLEGLLLVMPGETLQQDTIYEIAKMAALLHRAADMAHVPAMKETKFLLPKPALTVRDIKPAQWVNMVQSSWADVQGLETIQAKAQVLEMLSRWPLFGSSFFAVKRVSDPKERADHILALNRHGVHFIDIVTHETLLHHPFSEVISTRKVKSEDGTLFLDMKCGNLMQQRITRLQTDQAHEISRLIRQYITLQQRVRT